MGGVRPRLAFVSSIVPWRHSTSGFAARVHNFMCAASTDMDVSWIRIRYPHQTGSPEDSVVSPWRILTPPRAPWSEPGVRGRARRWLVQYPFGRLPSDAYPGEWPELRHALAEADADVIAFYLPYLAPLAVNAPGDVPVIAVLEEAWEKLVTGRLRTANAGGPDWLWRAVGRREMARYRRVYRRAGERASSVVAISEREKDWLSRSIDREKITVIPHGIDLSYFEPAPAGAETTDVLVLGDMTAARNYEGALQTWRAARARGWSWTFAGPVAPHVERELADGGAQVTGEVEDVRDCYRAARVVLVPAASGTGVKTTSIQAWASARPLVTSPLGARGLPAEPDGNILIGETPEQLVKQLDRALSDRALADRIAASGRSAAERSCDMSVLAQRFEELCHAAIGGVRSSRAPSPTA